MTVPVPGCESFRMRIEKGPLKASNGEESLMIYYPPQRLLKVDDRMRFAPFEQMAHAIAIATAAATSRICRGGDLVLISVPVVDDLNRDDETDWPRN